MIGLPFSKLNVYVYILNIRPIKEMRIEIPQQVMKMYAFP